MIRGELTLRASAGLYSFTDHPRGSERRDGPELDETVLAEGVAVVNRR
jgi:hypothetical protein